MHLITSAQMRAIEERAMDEMGIPSLILMENAAQQCVKHIMTLLGDFWQSRKVVVVCGAGNNGGDGFAIARLLHTKGVKTQAAFIGERGKVKGDALINMEMAERMGCVVNAPLQVLLYSADVIVDALFGTGLRGRLTDEKAAEAIELINACPAPVVSVDIPSGVEADSGRVSKHAVYATTTVTFGLAKLGHMLHPGTEYAGQVIVEDISIPQELLVPEGATLEVLDQITTPPRPVRSNKGDYGRVCVLAGSSDMPGAAALCCKAAYRAGAGLVHACVVPEVARVIRAGTHEVITTAVAEYDFKSAEEAIQMASAVAIGPGFGRDEPVQKFAREVIEFCGSENVPIVADADALIAIAADKSVLRSIQAANCVITPHPGEMAALTGQSIHEVVDDLVSCAQNFAEKYGVITLLKDARTIIAAPDGRTFINPTGTPALAKAGSGDVLTGVIAAYLAQGFESPHMAAVLAAYVHGRAGQLAAEALSVHGVCAGDLPEYVAKALA